MARDLAQHRIRVVILAPGLFLTPMLKGLPQAHYCARVKELLAEADIRLDLSDEAAAARSDPTLAKPTLSWHPAGTPGAPADAWHSIGAGESQCSTTNHKRSFIWMRLR